MRPSRVLHGRYEVGDLLGSGSTADVYHGRDVRTNRPVAIKILRRHLATDLRQHATFRREARTLAELNHTAVPAVYDTGYEETRAEQADAEVVPFLVMELVAGRPLREVLKRDRLGLADSVRYQLGLLEALEACHRAGVVHRDVKPANVMVTTEGSVKLIDLGLARGGNDPHATWTMDYAVLGTPSYFAPEQANGGTADARSDVYSAGCVLYEMLTGSPPFVGNDPVSVAYRHVHEQPIQVSTSMPAVDAVVMKALSKSPERRYEDARSFKHALNAAAGGPPARPLIGVADEARPHRGRLLAVAGDL